jgi:starch phosphorylase
MAIMGLRLAGVSNGVSRLHGDTSRRMFAYLWPEIPVDEVPIGSVTNGVHAPTWVAPEMADVFGRYVLPTWSEAGPKDWARILDARDDELWRAKEVARARLISVVRDRVRASLLARGVSQSDAAWCDEILDPHVLTIGFARRFATYKRADLVLSQPERLKRLLLSTSRPVQILFGGKAHPHDDAGKEMIRRIVQFSRDPEVRHRIVFVDDYDIAIARAFYQGADVWLNNPRRPEEASGTSGEKAALNAALNLSILDGWWDEMFDGENGWAISSAEGYDDLERRDEVEANSLFDILEHQVIPLFYDRSESPVPRRWIVRVKSSLTSLGPRVTAARMVRDYVEGMYEPLAAHTDNMTKSGHARARALAEWKARVSAAWSGVEVVAVDTGAGITDLGERRRVEAVVSLGKLTGDDVAVQLVHGVVGPNDELVDPEAVDMQLVSLGERDGEYRYGGEFVCARAGRHGLNVRVAPAHADQLHVCELGLMEWA